MSRLTRDGTAKPVSRDKILRRERRQGDMCDLHTYNTGGGRSKHKLVEAKLGIGSQG